MTFFYRVKKEFVWSTILFQVGVLRLWTEKEIHDFTVLTFWGDKNKFNEHFEIIDRENLT